MSSSPDPTTFLARLEATIAARSAGDPASSYVASLHAKGRGKMAQKVGEEATEVVMAAQDGDRARIVGEFADLWFHSLVALEHYGLGPADVLAELSRREGLSGLDEKASRADMSRPAPVTKA
jgi:phosphoribosyl-ATP pyrophosphohydrolase